MIELNAVRVAGVYKLPPPVLGKEIFIGLHFDPAFVGELVRSVAGEQDVFGPLHYEPGELHRVLDIANESHGPGLSCTAVHYGGVHLDAAFVSKNGTPTGVKERKILEP
jgi:hypothetical protein